MNLSEVNLINSRRKRSPQLLDQLKFDLFPTLPPAQFKKNSPGTA